MIVVCLQGPEEGKLLTSYADLKWLAVNVLKPRSGITQHMGLAKLVSVLLRRSLDKSEQVRTCQTNSLPIQACSEPYKVQLLLVTLVRQQKWD